jgi:3D (Asp-Asp-Asp) domain-containing protein
MENVDDRAGQEKKTEEPVLMETFIITAYCPCVKCCGKTDGITASGVKAVEGITVAGDTSKLPFGTKIYIDGVGERIVQDTGGVIKGNKIDLYFDEHQSALNFGRQTKQVTILN